MTEVDYLGTHFIIQILAKDTLVTFVNAVYHVFNLFSFVSEKLSELMRRAGIEDCSFCAAVLREKVETEYVFIVVAFL